MVAKSRPEIDIKEAVGKFELNVDPKSLLALDGSMLHCPCKSDLMGLLEKLDYTWHDIVNTNQNGASSSQPPALTMKVSVPR